MVDAVCGADKVCTCKNGTGATGTACREDGYATCVDCIPGFYTTGGEGEDGHMDCKRCDPGYGCNGGSTPEPCHAGHFAGEGASSCMPCGPDPESDAQDPVYNQYSDAQAHECKTCPSGFYTTGGADEHTHTGCKKCPNGFICEGTRVKISVNV
jgi:hypothetical protein